MKLFLKILAGLGVLLVLAIIVGLVYLYTKFPNVGSAKDLRITASSDMVERGKYLANHVSVCIDCHSTRDWTRYSGPIVAGTEGIGGFSFDERFGFPGKIIAKNITPYALNDWTDGEILRAITCGVNRKGQALFPVMPYPALGNMAEEDAYDVIAYLRTLKPLESTPPESKLDFPMNLIVRMIPKPAHPMSRPDMNDTLAYGKYVTTIAGCGDCHTPMVKGKSVPGMEFAGGFKFEFPAFFVNSANITPDKETGIGDWGKDDFIGKFKTYDPTTSQPAQLEENDFNTPMPWTMFAGMTDYDLGAIYSYLQTLKPIKHQVEKFTPKTQ